MPGANANTHLGYRRGSRPAYAVTGGLETMAMSDLTVKGVRVWDSKLSMRLYTPFWGLR